MKGSVTAAPTASAAMLAQTAFHTASLTMSTLLASRPSPNSGMKSASSCRTPADSTKAGP